ncbi:MAG TPA: class I SAM-dependent methyltransferase [Rhizomicrobium sp.]|nr:class I SAM-dependent methyltransferase [Rhizomicrobium sp.]
MSISCDYEVVSADEARRRQAGGWHRPITIYRQDRAYQSLLDDMRRGYPRIDLATAAKAVDRAGIPTPSILEIGCGSGYYSEILETLAASRIDYSGIDYSAAAVKRAQKRYPGGRFAIGDATALAFPGQSFDIAFNGVSLMHILDYEKAIAESARVARKAVIFHSTPVFGSHPTTYLHKYAYGAPVVEIVFNRDALIACFERSGLRLVESWRTIDYDVSAVTGALSHAETFYCEKRS